MSTPVRLGLYIHAGDGPARWGVELLDVSADAEAAAALACAQLAAQAWHHAYRRPASCGWRWRCANEIQEAALQDGYAVEIEHTHGAPVYQVSHRRPGDGGERYYRRPYQPVTAAEWRASGQRHGQRRLARRRRWELRCRRALKLGQYRPSTSIRKYVRGQQLREETHGRQ